MTTDLPENLPAITKADLQEVGFPEGMQMAAGLAVFLNDSLFKRCSSIAVRMANAAKEGVLPKHLADRPAACFAIISRAITWNLDPFAVAQCTYETPGGRIGYEGKLVQAILENSGHLEGGVRYEHRGDWSQVEGKYKMIDSQRGGKYPSPTWTPEDAKGLSVVVSAKVKGRAEAETLTFKLTEAFPLNSPLWATAPHRQICYTAVRAFANLCLPSILMGVPFDVDPVSFYGDPMPPTTDITPRKPDAPAKGNEFDRSSPRKDAEFKPDETIPAGKAADPPAVQETLQQQGEPAPQAETQSTGTQETPAQVKPIPETQPQTIVAKAEMEPQPDLLDDPAARKLQGLKDYLADLIGGDLKKCKHVRDVTELYKSEEHNFTDPEHKALLEEWGKSCKAKQQEIIAAANAPKAGAKK